MSAETGLHFDYRRDGRATGRLLVTNEEDRIVYHDQVNLDAARKRTEVAKALRESLPGLQEEAVLSELSQLALDVPPEAPRASNVQGQSLAFSTPEPWPDPVEGAVLLYELERTFRRFLALPQGADVLMPLFTVHTHAWDAAYIFPILALTSPTHRCGKTTALDVLSALVCRALLSADVSPAALFRAVEKWTPTVLVDEVDNAFERNDDLRRLLNAGHRRGGTVLRTVGDDYEPRAFRAWGPKAVALIGNLPGTLADRSIEVRMRRRAEGERVEQLRLDRLGELEPLRRKAVRWAADNLEALRAADPEVPQELHDRAADNWRPLLAIADLAGGQWPKRAREAARSILGVADASEASRGVLLLADLRELFQARDSGQLPTAEILKHLNALEDRPWQEWRRGQPMSAVSVSRLVKPFEIGPRQIRVDTRTCKGYRREDLEDAWLRYLPAQDPGVDSKHPKHWPNHAENPESSTRNTGGDVSGRESGENPRHTGDVSGVSPWRGGAEKEGPRELVVGGDFTPEQRGVPLVCPGCRGGMPEAGELCETCQYAADERLGMASS